MLFLVILLLLFFYQQRINKLKRDTSGVSQPVYMKPLVLDHQSTYKTRKDLLNKCNDVPKNYQKSNAHFPT